MGRHPPKGVSIAPTTGVLTITESADRGDFSVVATLAGGKGSGLQSAVFVAGDAFDAAAFLANDDTALSLTVGGAGGPASLRIRSLRHRTAGWEWIDDDGDSVPLPSPRGAPIDWVFKDATHNSSVAAFRFTAGQLQLESVWAARSGGGPVDNAVTVTNAGSSAVVFDSALKSLDAKLMTPMHSVYSQYEKRGAGTPLPPMEVILHPGNNSANPGLNFTVPVGGPGHVEKEGQYIPLAYINAGDAHGLYIGSEWELGAFDVSTRGGSDYLLTTLSVSPIGAADATKHLPEDFVTIATGSSDPDVPASFSIPTTYYGVHMTIKSAYHFHILLTTVFVSRIRLGVYQGDVDAGSNAFKRWFWEHKITRSLYANADEPWTEICWDPVSGGLFPYGKGTPRANQSVYEAAAATGVELLKVDCCIYNSSDRDWNFLAKDWPIGFDFTPMAHSEGLHTSLYLGGSYLDANLSTIAGRDAQLQAVRERYDKGWFDMWRTDTFTAPENPVSPQPA
jgi:hypothetical protein